MPIPLPSVPDELAWALSIRVTELTPAEFDAQRADLMYRATTLRAAWEEGKQEGREMAEEAAAIKAGEHD